MREESTNHELNNSNKDTFLGYKSSNPNLIRKSTDIIRTNIRQTVMMQEKIKGNNNTLDDLGKIEEAKKHRSANRPLHKIKAFNSNVNFCRCCNLPCEEKGIIEPFNYCDDIDKFAECGLGVSLYFYFFHFAIVIIFIGICILAISMMIFNHHYTKGINRVCNNSYKKNGNDTTKIIIYCEGFITLSNESLNLYERFNDWILRFTSGNMKVYRLLHMDISSTSNSEDVLINYSVLNFFFLLTIFILNIFYIIFIVAQSQKAKLLNYTIRDYTVLISNAQHILFDYLNTTQKENPKFIKNSQQLVENTSDFIGYLNEYIRCDKSLINLKINNINMCYNLGNYIDLRDDYEECVKKIFKIKNDPKIIELNLKEGNLFQNRCYYSFPLGAFGIKCIKIKGKPLITLQKQKSDLEKQIEFEIENMQIINESNFTGYMFVSFNRIKDKEIFLQRYPNHFFGMLINFIKNIKYYLCCCCISKGDQIKFNKISGIDADDPPEPEDLYWENFKYSFRDRVFRIILVFLVCLIIIALSFGLVLLFTLLQNKITQNEKNINLFVKYLLSFIISIIISVLNSLLELVLTKFTLIEKHLSRTNFYLSLSIKLTIFTFFNSAIIPFLSKTIIVEDKGKYNYNLDRNNLIVNDMFVLFTVNAIVTPILWTFYIPYLFKKLRICLLERNKEPDKCHYMTQKELNALYELPDMKIAYKYSYLAKTMAMTLFYLPIFPLGFIISCFGFILGYFLELYNFTHIYKRPEMIDEIITRVYADYFIIIIFIGAVGDYVFFHDIFPDNKMSLANIIIFGILIIIPYTKFINCNFVGIDKSEYHNYALSEVYFTFYNDYQRQNPFTKKVGLLNYLTELKKNGYLSNNAFNLAQENIENLNIMEIYYGISRGNIPIMTQSIMANTNNNRSISGQNIRKSIVAPNIKDNNKEKIKKQKYFDSQIMNMFSSHISKKIEYPIDFPMDTIIEENEENIDTKDKLINAYNNPLSINMGLGLLPMDENIYKSLPLTKSISKKDNSDINKFKNNLKNTEILEEKKNNENIKKNKKNENNTNLIRNNKNLYNNEIEESKNYLSFNSSNNSSNQELNKKIYNINNNIEKRDNIKISKKRIDEEYKEEEKNNFNENNQSHNIINITQTSNENKNNLSFNISINNENNTNEKYSDNYNNNNNNNNQYYDNNTPIKTNLNKEINNDDIQSFNEDNLNMIFNTTLKTENNNDNMIRHSSIKKLNINVNEEELINNKSKSKSNINDINNNKTFSQEDNNVIMEQKDIIDVHNFPYNNENNTNYDKNNNEKNDDINNDISKYNEEMNFNLSNNNDKMYDNDLSQNSSKGNDENNDYI